MARTIKTEPLFMLALAVIRQAAQDARAGDYDAAAWLRSGELAHLTYEALNVEFRTVDKWLLRL